MAGLGSVARRGCSIRIVDCVPVEQIRRFDKAYREAGNRCDYVELKACTMRLFWQDIRHPMNWRFVR